MPKFAVLIHLNCFTEFVNLDRTSILANPLHLPGVQLFGLCFEAVILQYIVDLSQGKLW